MASTVWGRRSNLILMKIIKCFQLSFRGYLLYLFMCVVELGEHLHMQSQREACGTWFSPSTHGLCRLNSGYQASWQTPFSTKSSHCYLSLILEQYTDATVMHPCAGVPSVDLKTWWFLWHRLQQWLEWPVILICHPCLAGIYRGAELGVPMVLGRSGYRRHHWCCSGPYSSFQHSHAQPWVHHGSPRPVLGGTFYHTLPKYFSSTWKYRTRAQHDLLEMSCGLLLVFN